VRKTNGTPINTTIAVHPATSETVGENEWAPTLIANRSNVVPPARRTGVSARRAAGLEPRQRRTIVATTARR
jgi:hypothetical protein